MAKYKYVPCNESEVPGNVRFTVPRYLQGQIVEIAYGNFGRHEGCPGDPYKCITDHGDRSVQYYKLVKS
jgi:hypothetical protein